MKTWGEAWNAATIEERKTVRYWRAGFGKDTHRNGLRGDRNQCTVCGEMFNSSSAFERHRTGSYGKPGVPSKRRCLTVPEMLAKGYEKNAAFFWTRGSNPLFLENAISSDYEVATIDD